MRVQYDSDLGFYDGLCKGSIYKIIDENEHQYVVNNDAGGTSTISKDKFRPVGEKIEKKMDILDMKPGPEMDLLIATQVMGLKEGVDFGTFPEHDWKKYEDSDEVDIFAFENGYCNGPVCTRCHHSYCHHCHEKGDGKPCVVKVRNYSGFGHIKGIEEILDKVGGLGLNTIHYNGKSWALYDGEDKMEYLADTLAELVCKYALIWRIV